MISGIWIGLVWLDLAEYVCRTSNVTLIGAIWRKRPSMQMKDKQIVFVYIGENHFKSSNFSKISTTRWPPLAEKLWTPMGWVDQWNGSDDAALQHPSSSSLPFTISILIKILHLFGLRLCISMAACLILSHCCVLRLKKWKCRRSSTETCTKSESQTRKEERLCWRWLRANTPFLLNNVMVCWMVHG